MLKRLLVLSMLFIPAAAWAFFKPIRIIAPELTGIYCINDTLCIDDVSRHQEAIALYDEALNFVDTRVGLIEKNPRITFCSTKNCLESFGLERRAGITMGAFGIVISPRAWRPYYVRHEMIHHLQNEKLGMINAWREPKWFMEGMAYSLSEDPRPKLSEPFELYRSKFNDWYKQVNKEQLWAEASNL